MTVPYLPWSFIWKRLHSLTGIFLVLYLIEHLFVNSQAALYEVGSDEGFVSAVNAIQSIPYLPFIEFFLLGVPIAVHMTAGIAYLWTSKINVANPSMEKPNLPEYSRNWAYTFQRITSWILLFAIIGHVVQMRFLDKPYFDSNERGYVVRLTEDPNLAQLAEKLDTKLFSYKESEKLLELHEGKKWALKTNEFLAVSKTFGAAELLVVRDTFKIPLMVMLYTLFVLAACYHAFNGFWSFLISWGITISARSQSKMVWVATALMLVVGFLGLSAIWGVYWWN